MPMRSKIIFVILFMLTFTVMHDSVINIIQKNEHTSISNYTDTHVVSQECNELQEVHGMFHFVGLLMSYQNTFVQLQKEETLSHNLLQYTSPNLETSHKPPIA